VSEETETKIVIAHKGNRSSIGIQRTSCDPIFFTTDGDIPNSLSRISEFLAEAERKWQTNPRNPKAELPEPPTPVPATANQTVKTTAKPVNKPQEAIY